MSNKLRDSELAIFKVKELDQSGKLYHHHAVELFNHLAKSLNVVSVSSAARSKGISPQAMAKRIKKRKELVVNCNGKDFISL